MHETITRAPAHRAPALLLGCVLAAVVPVPAEVFEPATAAVETAAIDRRLDAIERRLEAIRGQERRAALTGTPLDPNRLEQRLTALRRRLTDLDAALSAVPSGPAALGPSRLELASRLAALDQRSRAAFKPAAGAVAGSSPANAAPVNDTCAAATTIGNGAFSGDTSTAGSDGDATCGDSDFSPDTWFKYTAPAAASIYVNTFGSAYDTVLSLHTACPGTSGNEVDCNDDAGSRQSELLLDVAMSEVLYVRVSGYAGDAGSFALNVGPGGSISGTVTEQGTATPLASAQVTVYRAANGETDFIGTDLTAGDGTYSVGGLSPGSYRAIARSDPHVNELYDDVPCPGGINSCFPERGAAIAVAGGTDTSGIDFALSPGGSISGTVTEAAGSTPLAGASVGVYDASGNFIFNDLAASDGSYTVTGLPDGSYFVATRFAFATAPYAHEVWDDLACPGGGGSAGCPIRSGSPVAVTAPGDTPGIDFELALGGTIDGTVSEDGSGTPLADVDVELYTASGTFLDWESTAGDGSYEFEGLHTGSYREVTYFAVPHIDEAWNDVACYGGAPFGCAATDGSTIAVTAPSATSSIDFALTEGGAVSGTVTEQGSGTTLPYVDVEIYDPSGNFMDYSTSWGDGTWLVEGLPSGSYRAQTFGAAPHGDELYDDISCPGGWCDVAPGNAVAVSAPAETSGIDFALSVAGAISGTVTEDGSGTPLAGVDVDAFDGSGSFVAGDQTAPDGTYSIAGLPSASYYVTTSEAPLHVDELHSGVACPGGGFWGCDPTTGTAVAVSAPSATTGIDFALATGGTIEGSISDAVTSLPLGRDPEVTIFDSLGAPLNVLVVDGAGEFVSTGLPTGTYYARTQNWAGFADERWDDISCAGTCDPELGTAISVTAPSATSAVDFALHLPGADPELVLSFEELDAGGDFCATSSIALGPDLAVTAGDPIAFATPPTCP